jgi:hypothetical protein
VQDNVRGGRLHFTCDLTEPVGSTDVVFIAVGTPTRRGDGFADLSYVEAAAREIATALVPERYTVVVDKSTVPVGTGRRVEAIIRAERPEADFDVVSNPEFLREGSAIEDFMKPDRIVIGAEDQSAAVRVQSLYLGITAPVIVTDPASAETIKYAANAFLATKISFINAVAAVCEAVGADIKDVALGMGYDTRIGHEFLKPGPVKLKTGEMGDLEEKAATGVGVLGHLARMVVFGLVGVFLFRAAWEFDPKEARGLDGALLEVAQAPYGGLLLGAVAVGLLCYALYCLVQARYRKL